jgi:hypothetical protein
MGKNSFNKANTPSSKLIHPFQIPQFVKFLCTIDILISIDFFPNLFQNVYLLYFKIIKNL